MTKKKFLIIPFKQKPDISKSVEPFVSYDVTQIHRYSRLIYNILLFASEFNKTKQLIHKPHRTKTLNLKVDIHLHCLQISYQR